MRALNRYADCVVRLHGPQVDQYLSHVADMSAANERSAAVLVDSSCLGSINGGGGEMRANHLLFATARSDAVFRKKYASKPARNATTLPPRSQPSYPEVKTWQASLSAERNAAKRARLIQQFDFYNAQGLQLRLGECVIRQDSVNAKALLLASEATERMAMSALSPALSTCFSGLGQARFNRHLLRAVIGLNYVRLGLLGDTQTGRKQ